MVQIVVFILSVPLKYLFTLVSHAHWTFKFIPIDTKSRPYTSEFCGFHCRKMLILFTYLNNLFLKKLCVLQKEKRKIIAYLNEIPFRMNFNIIIFAKFVFQPFYNLLCCFFFIPNLSSFLLQLTTLFATVEKFQNP